ncbi:MAG: hypothetical protein A2219_06450 [Elusimicrobia bacterium RIFOXYA2_FULL_50_26]|nr:MAG: hypothetical protein A2219_06450 [Elusimicrobia bacterium RIFOXYA2_FULL_50_26]OGS24369.1 MAG: hypothetical protein A2314_00550 [Elusimicrobia bacterium RIFOXYB2_FULL_50_12]
MIKILTAALSLLCVISSFIFAGEEIGLDELLSRMEARDKDITSVQFDFTQEIAYTLTGEKQESGGSVSFQKPGKIVVRQQKPVEQSIITDGNKVWVYTPAYNQVIIDNWNKWIKNSALPASLMNFGTDMIELKKNYSFAYAGPEEDSYKLLLSPRKEGGWQLELWIDTATYVPLRTRLSGDTVAVTTRTENYKINPALSKTMFTFKPPKGTEVLHLP